MRNIKNRNIVLGIALLGVSAVAGFAQPSSAEPRRTVTRTTVVTRRVTKQPVYTTKRRVVTTPTYRTTRRVVTRTNNRNVYRTFEGFVTTDRPGNSFSLRTLNGQIINVRVQGREPRRISRGDRVRVSGTYTNGTLRTSSITLLRNR